MSVRAVELKAVSIVSTTIPATDYNGSAVTAWSGSTVSYVVGDVRYYSAATPHKVFLCKKDHTSAATPTPPDDATNWEWIGTLDKWAMFDDSGSTKSQDTTSFACKVDSSKCDYAGLYGLEAKSVTLTLTSGGETKKTDTIDLKAPMSFKTYYAWFFEPREYLTHVSWEYSKYASSNLEITVTAETGSTAKCGVFRVGKQFVIGEAEYETSGSLKDYSIKTKTSAGLLTFEQGITGDRISVKLTLNNDTVDSVHRYFSRLAGTPAIYNCNNESNYESLSVYGIFQSFDRVYSLPTHSRCDLTIESLL